MTRIEKIQTMVLFITGGVLLGCLLYGLRVQNNTVTRYEDGSFVGCQRGAICNE